MKKRAVKKKTERTDVRNQGRPAKKVVVFACLRGDTSRDYVGKFRYFLRKNGLNEKIEVRVAGTKVNPGRLEGADVIISPYFARLSKPVSPSAVSGSLSSMMLM